MKSNVASSVEVSSAAVVLNESGHNTLSVNDELVDHQAIDQSFIRIEQHFGNPEDASNLFSFAKAIAYDENDEFPIDHIDQAREVGMFDYFVPRSFGGKLNRFDELALLCRTMSRRDMTTSIAVGQSFLGALPVWLAGSKQQRQWLADQLLSGGLGCLALTEKAHGSDIFSTEVTAVETDHGLQISGQKWLINNATQGVSMSLLVKKMNAKGGSELALLYLDKSRLAADGFHNIDKIKTHGIRGADISGIEFDDCIADKNTLIKSDEATIFSILKGLQVSRILCAGFSMGALDTAMRVTLDFALQRQLYGKSIVAIAPVKKTLTNQFCNILAADIVSQVCSRAINERSDQLSLWSAICKYFVPVTSEQTVAQLRVVLGARNYLRDEHCYGVFQKLARDNEVVALFDGSTQINLGIIASQLSALANRLPLQSADETTDLLPELFLIDYQSRDYDVLNAKQFALSNNGSDVVIEAFLGLVNQLQNADIGDYFSSDVRQQILALEQMLQNLCHEVIALDEAGNREPNSIARFQLAQRYIQIWAGAVVVLMWYHNKGVNSLFSMAILNQILANLLLNVGDQQVELQPVAESIMDEVMGQLGQLHSEKRLFSMHTIKVS